MDNARKLPVDLWNDLYLTIGISFGIANMDGELLHAFPKELQKMVDPQLYEFCSMEIRKHHIKTEVMIYFISDIYYCIICPLDQNLFLVSVPVSMQKSNAIPLNFIHHFVRSDYRPAFLTLIYNTHSVFQASRFANLVKSVYSSENVGEILMYEHIKTREKPLEHEPEKSSAMKATLDEEYVEFNNPSVYLEEGVIDAIMKGDQFACLQALNRRFTGSFGHMSNDSIQQQKYEFVIGLYVFTHAAIRGGLDVEFALRLSDHYCRRLDTVTSVKSIKSLELTAAKDFCEHVKEAKNMPEWSREVSLCYNYILQHLYEPIRLNDMERIADMNRKNLTIHFKREMGMTIPEYILMKRLEESKYLLKTTDISLSDISSLLCFSSQSHFTQRFKERYHITPKQYREGIYTDIRFSGNHFTPDST